MKVLMKYLWIILALLPLLASCNPISPPVETEGNGTTKESQTGESTDRMDNQVDPDNLKFEDFLTFKEHTSTWDEVIERVGHPVPDSFGHVPTDWPYYWETSEGKVVIVFDEEDIVVSITYHPNDTQTT